MSSLSVPHDALASLKEASVYVVLRSLLNAASLVHSVNVVDLAAFIRHQLLYTVQDISFTQHTSQPLHIPATFATEAMHWLRYASAVYGSDVPEFCRRAQVDANALIAANMVASPLRPAYVIALDHAACAIVLTVRGTHSLRDLLTDAAGDTVPFQAGEAHQGMAVAADILLGRHPVLHGTRVVMEHVAPRAAAAAAAAATAAAADQTDPSSSRCLPTRVCHGLTSDAAHSDEPVVVQVTQAARKRGSASSLKSGVVAAATAEVEAASDWASAHRSELDQRGHAPRDAAAASSQDVNDHPGAVGAVDGWGGVAVILQELINVYPGYRVVCVGHSLGAGVVSLITMRLMHSLQFHPEAIAKCGPGLTSLVDGWRSEPAPGGRHPKHRACPAKRSSRQAADGADDSELEYIDVAEELTASQEAHAYSTVPADTPEHVEWPWQPYPLHCYCFGAPACVSPKLAEFYSSHITTCVMGQDFIPRVSVHSLLRLRARVNATRDEWWPALVHDVSVSRVGRTTAAAVQAVTTGMTVAKSASNAVVNRLVESLNRGIARLPIAVSGRDPATTAADSDSPDTPLVRSSGGAVVHADYFSEGSTSAGKTSQEGTESAPAVVAGSVVTTPMSSQGNSTPHGTAPPLVDHTDSQRSNTLAPEDVLESSALYALLTADLIPAEDEQRRAATRVVNASPQRPDTGTGGAADDLLVVGLLAGDADAALSASSDELSQRASEMMRRESVDGEHRLPRQHSCGAALGGQRSSDCSSVQGPFHNSASLAARVLAGQAPASGSVDIADQLEAPDSRASSAQSGSSRAMSAPPARTPSLLPIKSSEMDRQGSQAVDAPGWSTPERRTSSRAFASPDAGAESPVIIEAAGPRLGVLRRGDVGDYAHPSAAAVPGVHIPAAAIANGDSDSASNKPSRWISSADAARPAYPVDPSDVAQMVCPGTLLHLTETNFRRTGTYGVQARVVPPEHFEDLLVSRDMWQHHKRRCYYAALMTLGAGSTSEPLEELPDYISDSEADD